MEISDLQQILEQRLPNCEFFLKGDGRHFSLTAISDDFIGLSKLKSQQYIYSALKEEFASGKVHALEIKTYTKAVWAKVSKA